MTTTLRRLTRLGLALSMLLAVDALAQQRALLIGINAYAPETASGEARDRAFPNLKGTHNDVAAMQSLLTVRFGFGRDEVRVLLDADATRRGILDALDDLVALSETGNLQTVVFYYSGHGSQIRNTASPEADGMDETLVPSDAFAGVEEVRDKEVRRRFNALLENGVELTAIYDNCHSGSASRGVGDAGTARKLEPSPLTVADPPPYGREPSSFPAALVISAAGEDQLAREFETEDGVPQGVFTHALVQVLRTAPAELPARLLFQQVVARLKGLGFAQDPQLEAGALRYDRPLFGSTAAEAGAVTSGTVVAVQKDEEGALTLQAGLALGIRTATVLRSLSEAAEVRLRVTAARGPALADVEVIEGSAEAITSGDLFAVTKWVADPSAPLNLYLPPPLGPERTSSVIEALDALDGRADVTRVSNPARTPPTHVLAWNGSSWLLQRQGKTSADLGPAPTAEALARALGPDPVALFLHLPASPEYDAALRASLQELGTPIRFAEDVTQSEYFLSAYPEGDLAWFYRRATDGTGAGTMPSAPQVIPASFGAGRAADYLAQQVLRLSALWGWVHLETPGGESTFPYRLDAFIEAATGEALTPGDTLRWGEGYRVRLATNPDHLSRIRAQASIDPDIPTEWYYYLFAIDCTGAGGLLHGRRNEAKVDLYDMEVPETLVLGGSSRLFRSVRACENQPTETDQFFLLATTDPLPDPTVLGWPGVGTNERSRGPRTSPLGALLTRMSDGRRGFDQPAPSGWSVSRIGVPSIQRRSQ